MGSRSSRRKSASAPDVRALQHLLRDGAVLEAPDGTAAAAAAHLEGLGLIKAERRSFVRCASPRDPGYPPPVRDCPGRIWLAEEGDPGICPECERQVDPYDPPKRRHQAFHVHVVGDGVMAYLAALAAAFGTPSRPDPGVFRFRAEPADAFVCVPELCHDEHRLRRDTASNQPTVLVTLEPGSPHRVLPEPWLVHTTLAALVAGEADLGRLLLMAADQVRPTTYPSASVPIYAPGARPIVSRPADPQPSRRFAVHITHEEARVEGVVVAGRKARVQLLVLQILAKRFLRSLLAMAGEAPEPMSADAVANRLQRITGEEREDRESVRKAINRLQDTMADRVKRTLGLPIGREDIIETVPWRGTEDAFGYRLNPLRVVIGLHAGSRS